MAILQWNKIPIKIIANNADFVDSFSSNQVIELPDYIGMNEYAVKLIKSKQPPYRPIYDLSPVILKTLKTYIKIHLKSGFIQSSKFPASAYFFFDKKPDSNFRLSINY